MSLTDAGKNLILGLLLGTSTETLTNGGVGVDDDFSASHTTLQSSVSTIDSCDATTGWVAAGDATTETVNTTSFQEGTGSLNLGATFSSGDSHYTKTVTSFDASATNDKIYFFFYINDLTELTDTTDAVYVRLGTGGQTNYNKYDTSRDALSNGWNSIIVNVASPDSTGGTGADETDIDSVRIGFKNGTSITLGDARMDYIRFVTDGGVGITDSVSAFISSTSNKAATLTYKVLATQSNGYDISSAGLSTTTTPVLFTKQTFSAINKDENTEIQIDEFLTVK